MTHCVQKSICDSIKNQSAGKQYQECAIISNIIRLLAGKHEIEGRLIYTSVTSTETMEIERELPILNLSVNLSKRNIAR